MSPRRLDVVSLCAASHDEWSVSVLTFRTLDPASEPLIGGVEQTAERVYPLFSELQALDHAVGGAARLERSIRVQQIVLWWMTRRQLSEQQSAEDAVLETIRYAQRQFAEPLTKQTLARRAGLSLAHYYALFHKLTGVGPAEYLASLRINRAKELLLHNNLPLHEVAPMAGFKDGWYLSRRFKQRTGMTPTRFRSSKLTQVAAYSSPCYGHLLALGVEPVAAVVPDWQYSQTRFQHAGATRMISQTESEERRLEALALLRPEAAFCLDALQEEGQSFMAQVRTFAPTVEIPWMSMDWLAQLERIAQLCGRASALQSWMDRYEQRRAQTAQLIRKQVGESETVAILVFRPEGCCVYGVRNVGYVLYRALGLTPPAPVAERLRRDSLFHSRLLAPAELPAYAADRILVMIREELPGSRHSYEQLRHSSAWEDMMNRGVKQVQYIKSAEWLGYDPSSIYAQLGHAERLFISD
ncbi:AraC family transcriptional regulator [Paenibacillus sp. 598K]|uniref:AraC family transcriptional regulator n=1 Tax=Paenibacillus sp. 598K TaxID=1117987 RepID=UPI001629180B|nr:AraC family transcriptional regulator [Paenibacillus sp. 598K]